MPTTDYLPSCSRRAFLRTGVFGAITAAIGAGSTIHAAPPPTATPAPAMTAGTLRLPNGTTARLLRDVTYCTIAEGQDLTLDLLIPPNAANPAPVAVYVHGGGWTAGDKSVRTLEGLTLASRGYIVAAVAYRLAPAFMFPAQIVDVKCAVRFLRANAAMYGLDSARIVTWGDSAGGHLVSLLGLTDASAGWDTGPYADQSSAVRAVVDQFGPSDLTLATPLQKGIATVFGTDPETLGLASPVTYVHTSAPPFLIQQGEKDTTVPPSQSQELYDRLTAAGASAKLVLVANAGHSFKPIGGAIDPSRADLATMVADFFDASLQA